MNYLTIICHYGEIALKGGNRPFFEKQLVQNIKQQLSEDFPEAIQKVQRRYGSIAIILTPRGAVQLEALTKALVKIFGIVHFFIANETAQEMVAIKKAALELLQKEKFETFRITTQRSEKSFPLTSEQISRQVGSFIVEKMQKKVSLKNPEKTCFIEISGKSAFLYAKKIKGAGGLPVGTAGRAMVLLSGGLDSPVAAHYALKRGLNVKFVHFHSIPYTSKASLAKVTQLVAALKKYKASGKIFSVPFARAQKEIMLNCPDNLRIILYRRLMLRIAQAVARKNRAQALITGDSLGQVASQTLENLSVVGQACDLLLLRPLIGMDKEEIMQKAREIGTYDISILPHDDCCTRLMPKKPELRAKLEDVLAAEKNLDIEKIISEALRNMEVISVP